VKKDIVIVTVLILAFVIGCTSNTNDSTSEIIEEPEEKVEEIIKTPARKTPPKIEIIIQKKAREIIFTATSSEAIFVPVSDYWYPQGSWEIEKVISNSWVKIYPADKCLDFCDTVCKGSIACIQGGAAPLCNSVSKQVFVWDKTYVDFKNTICEGTDVNCAYYKDADAGRYKIRFLYKTDCSQDELYAGDSLTFELDFLT